LLDAPHPRLGDLKPHGHHARPFPRIARREYLPPYSPDLNPIELAFAKLKKLLRDGAERTVDKLWELWGRILDEFTQQECRNYFQHCDYRYT
jgi:transposase